MKHLSADETVGSPLTREKRKLKFDQGFANSSAVKRGKKAVTNFVFGKRISKTGFMILDLPGRISE